MPDHPREKAQLRTDLRQRRRNLPAPAQRAACHAITEFAAQLPGWLQARRVALYLANDGEVDTTALAAMCRATGMQLFLPVIESSGLMAFAEWVEGDKLETNRYGIPEPDVSATRCAASELDIVVLPLVAWDRSGGRLGMGSGFYDRALADTTDSLLVGLSHALQEVPRVPCEDWDVAMDFVVTEAALHCCKENK